MELERMRELLATKAMGWKCNWGDWMSENESVWEMSVKQWHPDTDWAQCGLVIEAMREKGWDWHVSAYASGSVSASLWHEETGKRFMVSVLEDETDERYTRMLCAARALEATDE